MPLPAASPHFIIQRHAASGSWHDSVVHLHKLLTAFGDTSRISLREIRIFCLARLLGLAMLLCGTHSVRLSSLPPCHALGPTQAQCCTPLIDGISPASTRQRCLQGRWNRKPRATLHTALRYPTILHAAFSKQQPFRDKTSILQRGRVNNPFFLSSCFATDRLRKNRKSTAAACSYFYRLNSFRQSRPPKVCSDNADFHNWLS